MNLNRPSLFRQQCYIDGTWTDASNGQAIEVTNPMDSSLLGTVPSLTQTDVKTAIDAANRALPAWRAMSGKQRAQLIRNWYDLCMAHQEDLARLLNP